MTHDQFGQIIDTGNTGETPNEVVQERHAEDTIKQNYSDNPGTIKKNFNSLGEAMTPEERARYDKFQEEDTVKQNYSDNPVKIKKNFNSLGEAMTLEERTRYDAFQEFGKPVNANEIVDENSPIYKRYQKGEEPIGKETSTSNTGEKLTPKQIYDQKVQEIIEQAYSNQKEKKEEESNINTVKQNYWNNPVKIKDNFNSLGEAMTPEERARYNAFQESGISQKMGGVIDENSKVYKRYQKETPQPPIEPPAEPPIEENSTTTPARTALEIAMAGERPMENNKGLPTPEEGDEDHEYVKLPPRPFWGGLSEEGQAALRRMDVMAEELKSQREYPNYTNDTLNSDIPETTETGIEDNLDSPIPEDLDNGANQDHIAPLTNTNETEQPDLDNMTREQLIEYITRLRNGEPEPQVQSAVEETPLQEIEQNIEQEIEERKRERNINRAALVAGVIVGGATGFIGGVQASLVCGAAVVAVRGMSYLVENKLALRNTGYLESKIRMEENPEVKAELQKRYNLWNKVAKVCRAMNSYLGGATAGLIGSAIVTTLFNQGQGLFNRQTVEATTQATNTYSQGSIGQSNTPTTPIQQTPIPQGPPHPWGENFQPNTSGNLIQGNYLKTEGLGWNTSEFGWKGPDLFVPTENIVAGGAPDLQGKFMQALLDQGISKPLLMGQDAGRVFNQGLVNGVYRGGNIEEVAKNTADALKALASN